MADRNGDGPNCRTSVGGLIGSIGMLRRRKFPLLILGLAIATACTDWSDWDMVFLRDDMEECDGFDPAPRRWTGGDAGISVELPGGGLLWLFGDTLTGDVEPSTHARIPHPNAFLTGVVFGNTIGILPDAESSEPRCDMQFLARRFADGSVQDITNHSSGETFRAFFDPGLLGITEDPDKASYLWPHGGTCVGCEDGSGSSPHLLLGFKRIQFCSGGEGCTELGVKTLGHHIVSVENPSDPPASWIASQVEIPDPMSSIAWGSSFLEVAGDLWIYGVDEDGRVYVARAPGQSTLEPATWFVRTQGDAWSPFTTTPLMDLEPVAEGVGSLFTIDEIEKYGVTYYLLVHAHPVGDHMLFVRPSTQPDAWPALDETTTRLDLVSIDDVLESSAQLADGFTFCLPGDEDENGQCPDPIFSCDLMPNDGVVDLDECTLSYHGLAHEEISFRAGAANEISSLVVSYVVPVEDITVLADGSSNPTMPIEYYTPRFAFIPLGSIPPWCDPTISTCWRGVNHQYRSEWLDAGQRRTYHFDISDGLATEFVADLRNLVGGAYLSVEIQDASSANLAACDSAPEDPGSNGDAPSGEETCSVAVPAGAHRARLHVDAQSDTMFTVRASYDSGHGVFD